MLPAVMDQQEIGYAQIAVPFFVFEVMIDQQRKAQQLAKFRSGERKNQQEQYVHALIQQGEITFFSGASFPFCMQNCFFPE
ncbi:MAG: hypothetical protein RLZZ370_581 [Bacteroidota bacterium]|jgi:hypothetical protein